MKVFSIVIAIVIAIMGLTVVFDSWYTIDEGERGVVLLNGAVTGVASPGLNFKLPWFESVVTVDTREHNVKWHSENSMNAYSKDQQPAQLTVSINFRVPAERVQELYTEYGSLENLVDRLISRKVPQEIKTIFGKFDAVSVIQDRTRFNQEAFVAVAKSLENSPVLIDSVQIENIDFSDAYENSVEQRMMAQVEVQKRQQELATRKIEAEITVTQAQAQADSNLAIAKAQADAIRLKGEAEAQAIRARAAALADNPALVELTKAERWNGELPKTMLPNATIPFIDALKNPSAQQ